MLDDVEVARKDCPRSNCQNWGAPWCEMRKYLGPWGQYYAFRFQYKNPLALTRGKDIKMFGFARGLEWEEKG